MNYQIKNICKNMQLEMAKLNKDKTYFLTMIDYERKLRDIILETGFKKEQLNDVTIFVINSLTVTGDIEQKSEFLKNAISEGVVKEFCISIKFLYDEFKKDGFDDQYIYSLISSILSSLKN